MTWSEIVLVVIVVIGALVLVGWYTAHRLDRLHRKVVASRLALDTQLARRGIAITDLASSGAMDPASSMVVLAAVVQTALDADTGDAALRAAVPDLADHLSQVPEPVKSQHRPSRAAVSAVLAEGLDTTRLEQESNLSRAVRAALFDEATVAELYEDPEIEPLLNDVAQTWYRVQLARRFHNESVDQAQVLRRKTLVRWGHLAGHAPMPQPVDMDDAWPEFLRRPAPVLAIADGASAGAP